ncbi:MAG: response regulator transcription factor [Acidobacteriaceae bacterium]|nr:response regulator transcription factor [Acidobacteriaceae bacterium]
MSSVTAPIRVLIADAFPIVIDGVRSILQHSPGIQIVGECSDGGETVEKVLQLDPDVLVLDLKLPRTDGLSVLRNLQAQDRANHTKVLLFASAEQKDEFVDAMKLGCSGILLKDNPTHLIEKSIQKVHAGEIWLDSTTTAAVIRQFASPNDHPNVPSTTPLNGSKPSRERAQLSQREREIIILIAQGYKNKEIAEKMFITEQTVKNHLHNVFDKLGVSDRLELALYAIHNSLHVKS